MANLFRVLQGSHSEGGKLYDPGDIVDSASDLLLLNSPGSIKFEKVEEGEDTGKLFGHAPLPPEDAAKKKQEDEEAKTAKKPAPAAADKK
jgi:hypothetical protein